MYDENKNNQEFDNGMNPDEHKTMEDTPNFVMKDSNHEANHLQNQGMQEEGQGQPGNSQEHDRDEQQSKPQYVHSQQPSSQVIGSCAQPQYSRNQYQNDQQAHQFYQSQQAQYHQRQTSDSCQISHIPPERDKKASKKSGMARKVAGITAAALLFGSVAGGMMVGINALSDSLKKEDYPQVSQSATLPENSGGSIGTAQGNIAISTDVSGIVEKVMPSVVAINNTMLYQGSTWFGQSQTYEVPSSGSGIIVGQNDDELLLVTNNHVIQDANTLSVVFIDDTSVNAAVKGTDSESDLAVIAVPLKDIPETTLSQISIATLGESDGLKVGQGVVAIGNALGYGQSVTVGYISALNREVRTEKDLTRNLLQTDAAINPGNSGGALLNMKGEVIGINAAKYSSTEVEGMGYAIPISKAQDIINNLMTKKTRNEVDAEKAGYLGIQGQNVSDEMATMLDMPTGIFVYKIIEGGAASKTDLREKDIIVKFDDQTVRTMANLQDMLRYYEEGETVNLTVNSLENGSYVERTISITLGAKAVSQVEQ